jgi:glycosyltransferase involved in cell wall biosynthesis
MRPLCIGKIWDSEYPWDVRVEKVCGALVSAGHRVELVCRNRTNRPVIEERDGIRIHRMPFHARWPALLERRSSFPAFMNPRWWRLAYGVFRAANVDLVLCRDLPLAPLALRVARRLGRPLLIDIAEHYPGLLKDLYNFHDFRPHNLLVRNPLLAKLVERSTLPHADGVLVVVAEMTARLAALGVPADRITLVSNTPTRQRIEAMTSKTRYGNSGELRLVYLGKVERSRGLGTVLKAMRATPAVTLDVFGDGSSLQLHRRSAERWGLNQRVTFHGHRAYDEVLGQLSRFDAGVIPHHATDHWNYTIQNKLFDYMAAGLPVVVSSMPPAVRIVTEAGAGMVFRDREPRSLITVLNGLAEPVKREALGKAGRAAVEKAYNWDRDAERLIDAVSRLAAQVPPADSGRRGGRGAAWLGYQIWRLDVA